VGDEEAYVAERCQGVAAEAQRQGEHGEPSTGWVALVEGNEEAYVAKR
jgi:hypothetical protein